MILLYSSLYPLLFNCITGCFVCFVHKYNICNVCKTNLSYKHVQARILENKNKHLLSMKASLELAKK